MRVVTAALRLRRDRPNDFIDGGYTPLLADGPAAEHLAAFVRGTDVLTAVTRHSLRLSEAGWGDTVLTLPAGTWEDRIGAARFSGPVSAADLFARVAGRAAGADRPMTEFSVWAPRPDRVRLDVDGTLHPMTRSGEWWRADVDARPDARYGFVLDDDPTVLPDPRSPRQPDGVHERSQLWQPAPNGVDGRRLAGPLDRGPGDL